MSIIRGMNHIGLTVPDIESATTFFEEGLDAEIAYDSQTVEDTPRGGAEVERFLGLPKGTKIVKKRMIVIGNGPNIEMFQFENDVPDSAIDLQDFGYSHISFYVDDIEAAYEKLKAAGGAPLSEIHQNTRYEDTEGNGTVYFKTPWGSLIELQTLPNGYYYPGNSAAEVFIPEKR